MMIFDHSALDEQEVEDRLLAKTPRAVGADRMKRLGEGERHPTVRWIDLFNG
jgi:hypothetical protein